MPLENPLHAALSHSIFWGSVDQFSLGAGQQPSSWASGQIKIKYPVPAQPAPGNPVANTSSKPSCIPASHLQLSWNEEPQSPLRVWAHHLRSSPTKHLGPRESTPGRAPEQLRNPGPQVRVTSLVLAPAMAYPQPEATWLPFPTSYSTDVHDCRTKLQRKTRRLMQ